MTKPPYRDGYVHVMAEKCATCIFRPGNLMSLRPGRLKELIDDNLATDGAVTCHKTLMYPDQEQAVCRGFYDRFCQDVLPLRLAKQLDIIKEQT